jgi:hypothetical protein
MLYQVSKLSLLALIIAQKLKEKHNMRFIFGKTSVFLISGEILCVSTIIVEDRWPKNIASFLRKNQDRICSNCLKN